MTQSIFVSAFVGVMLGFAVWSLILYQVARHLMKRINFPTIGTIAESVHPPIEEQIAALQEAAAPAVCHVCIPCGKPVASGEAFFCEEHNKVETLSP